jgi:cell filamentation protein
MTPSFISDQERDLRQKTFDSARCCVRLEGLEIHLDDEPLFQCYVRGETDLDELLRSIRAACAATVEPDPVARRERAEAACAVARIVELRVRPIESCFNIAHLKETHNRIFQDLPTLGFKTVAPGEYRPVVEEGRDWVKNRRLDTVSASTWIAYSPMDSAAQNVIVQTLDAIDLPALAAMAPPEFSAAIGDLYTRLDYLHPFGDGNSRTLREFSRALAKRAGYELDWDFFGRTRNGRDVLCIARDLAVNKIALPAVQSFETARAITLTLDLFEGNALLPDLIGKIVSRS